MSNELAIKNCPHCGGSLGYYRKIYVSGWIRDSRLFETGEPYNSEMYDHLNYSRESKSVYCMDCGNKIKVTPNEILKS